jgi:fatty acid-binding protein DegV
MHLMPATCILTDHTLQISQRSFAGQRLLKALPYNGQNRLPDVDDFLRAYRELEREFNHILVLTISGHLLPTAEIAQLAASQHGGVVRISVLDSQQVGAGLGILAQIGAQAAAADYAPGEVEAQMRAAIPHLYTLMHVETENLAQLDYGHPSQAAPGETPAVFPLFALEEGQLVPYKKVRTKRHLLESFQEFIEEFEHPQHIVYMHGAGNLLRIRPFREMVRDLFSEAFFGEVEFCPALAALFGDHAVGVTVLEMPERYK